MTTEEQKAWDRFAAAALGGLLSRDTVQDENCNNAAKWAVMNPIEHFTKRAKQAAEYADEMMEQRKARMR